MIPKGFLHEGIQKINQIIPDLSVGLLLSGPETLLLSLQIFNILSQTQAYQLSFWKDILLLKRTSQG